MSKHVDPDALLLKMPSLRAVKAFVAAAKYQSFTRAAEATCVSQAAISRQIRELENHLGAKLFSRVGRTVELTAAGALFFDAAQLSFVNIAQAAERIRSNQKARKVLTVCCSPAFSALWLSNYLPEFFSLHGDIEINLITTQNFLTMEPGMQPDVFITKISQVREGYRTFPMCHDIIYPVCSPYFLEQHPEIRTLEGVRNSALLNLSPYGRSQVAEHVDWGVWLAFQGVDIDDRPKNSPHPFNANDYNLLISMVLTHQGIALGWNHLVAPLLEKGVLVRPIAEQVVLRNSWHYLACREGRDNDDALKRFCKWALAKFPRR
ncbi:LysR family transcriptional regulator [Pseudomonas sp. JZ134]|uniref:LysR family transcriptional regulator n=1 Tax=Pseudomonas sp. JZ134 TaxID=2806615 RepID=UPI003DA0ED2A